MSEAAKKNNLRQKTWGVFVRPYQLFSGVNHVSKGAVYVPTLGVGGSGYTTALGGESWMLNATATSFTEIRAAVKKVMDELGIPKGDILITEIVPFDHVITPLS